MAKAPKVEEPVPLDVIEATSPEIDEAVLVGGQSDTVQNVHDIAASVVSEIAEGAGDAAVIVEGQTVGFARVSAEQADWASGVNPLSVAAVLPLALWASLAASYLRAFRTFLPTERQFGQQA
ncbi:hypothetical protein OIU34_15480 [Pararhizobium sp. BT-229]|uniref:hypothetical protein n=1 Tax=Pararhizobium sp. BT-229 TaxID=2986923 RepID=UPI0021F722D7|nr:hypothetical protein [Pararhizobium sp. BT-229]MCV9963310.1 hypothetical protein [Pararhizobium sp. BT-229]